MPTILAHAAFGWSLARLGTVSAEAPVRRWVPVVAGLLAMLPDADVVGFRFGIHYGDLLGHRGITHSVVFALVTSGLAFLWLRSAAIPLFLAALSHPLLDMLTDGGLGVALWAPFSAERLFFPVTPIPVSPIGIGPGLKHVFLYEGLVFGTLTVVSWLLSRMLTRRFHAVHP